MWKGSACSKHIHITASILSLENAVTKILMAAAWLYLSYAAILKVKC